MNKVGVRNWFSLVIAGLVGQFAWTIENMFLNLYIFEQTQDAGYVPWMVAFSAAAATITTLLMGALSDRLGKRKAFVSFGYIAWGLSVLSFAFITTNNMAALFPLANAAMLAGVFIIILDCLMTFFGSTANDASSSVPSPKIFTWPIPATSSPDWATTKRCQCTPNGFNCAARIMRRIGTWSSAAAARRKISGGTYLTDYFTLARARRQLCGAGQHRHPAPRSPPRAAK